MADTLSRMYKTTEKRNCPKNVIKNISKDDVTHDLNGIYEFKDLLNYVKTNPNCINFPPDYNQDENSELAFELLSDGESVDFVHDLQEKDTDDKEKFLFSISDDLDKIRVIEEQKADSSLTEIIGMLNKEELNINE